MTKPYNPFKDRHKFQDDVWGQIRLNDLERDVIDTPEFQRLFRTSQLGFVGLVYHTANHTRGAHSIGACRITNRLINRLVDNTSDLYDKHEKDCPGLYADFDISESERVLVRLGALLHDVSHIPLSHDLERKSHKILYKEETLKLRSWYGHYDKHDDYESNPLLYLLLCGDKSSVLARVLQYYSKFFWDCLKEDAKDEKKHGHIGQFVKIVSNTLDTKWKPEQDLLPQLLFHLLFYEKEEEAINFNREIATSFDGDKKVVKWHLGPDSLTDEQKKEWHELWYQPFRHDIIGNTLSADLIDYLTRDPQRLGTQRRVDLHLLSYYALVNRDLKSPTKRYRCAIDLHDHKRGTTRTFLLNDLFRLLDLRQDIHEKAVVHRVVQSANAMLARGLLLLGDKKPLLKEVVGLGMDQTGKKQYHSLQSEDLFFSQLLKICDTYGEEVPLARRQLDAARKIFQKLVERRVCRPLVIIPGDWAAKKLLLPRAVGKSSQSEDFPLRTLAAIVDSAYYSPFLLFVCSCVEKYLEGVFDTDFELCKHVKRITDDNAPANLVETARNVVPSRVIIWTAPYKQLYKDPAVVVALEGCVDQIDEVIKPNHEPINDESTRVRIESAIGDADSKYATLWQLYVFISDGLYYSGVLNKIIRHLPTQCTIGQISEEHKDRLKKAQALLSVAFEAVCSNWSGLNDRLKRVKEKQQVLEERMDAEAFKQLVGRWVGVYGDKKGRVEKLSTVNVEHYYHECALDEKVEEDLKRPCRDSRYKFDKDAEAVWKDALKKPESEAYNLIQFLKTCHLTDPKLFSVGEFEELVELYKDAEAREKCDLLLSRATTDQTFIPKALKALWLSGFPQLVELERDKKVIPVVEPLFPRNELEIRKWLQSEIKILNPNVRRNLTGDLDPLVEILVTASARHGRVVFEDFQERLHEESSLRWNNVRVEQLVVSLKDKWNQYKTEGSSENDRKG